MIEQLDTLYNEEGYYIKNRGGFFAGKKLVTVITPVYNAEPFLEKTIESVINQSIGFKNIEFIIVDDHSTDGSRQIIWDYAAKYPNIKAVFLKKNTGSPAAPRNLGIELAKTDWVTFLDADDWLHEEGVKALYDLAKETGDNYVAGRTMKAESGGFKIVGEHQSAIERRSVSPFTIKHIFQHLGPTARMMKRKLLLDKNIRFPHLKFAEDKQFFIDVLINCPTISTTKKVAYYANRLDENESSLTSKTTVMEKTDTNIQVIKYVKQKKLPEEQEKMILNRLYEFDCITRLFDRQHFLKSETKEDYFDKFREVLATASDLDYEISDNFFHPFNRTVYRLFLQEDYQQMIDLIRWNKKTKQKQHIIKDGLPYITTPFEGTLAENIRVPLLAIYQSGYFEGDSYHLTVQIFGEEIDKVEELVFRNRQDVNEEYAFTLQPDESRIASISIEVAELDKLPTKSFEVFIRYDVYRKINILRPEQLQIDKRLLNFYTTLNSNLGFKITKA
ncbi:glycosyltransferase family 2 protein [Planococcus halotolerans]|uniref:Glycosyltransferase family 2 protein n=1 Tax=Planococcus halotolerans TaxID=2233542 RepID=A0A365L2L8_9BACL|nr:glycosyltransferase family 2 protein [Planococcus halotolerans]RAZ79634.1 glycosyltransferase family 2 protein [Planococcus halotolerans]